MTHHPSGIGVSNANAGQRHCWQCREPWPCATSQRSARAAEIAAGLAELGTGGTPAFIRGYNFGFDDAWEQLAPAAPAAPALDVDLLWRAIAGQDLYHGRYGTVPAGRTTALAIAAAYARLANPEKP